jgi:hypothetical protein
MLDNRVICEIYDSLGNDNENTFLLRCHVASAGQYVASLQKSHSVTPMMQSAVSPQTAVYTYQAIWQHIPLDAYFQSQIARLAHWVCV